MKISSPINFFGLFSFHLSFSLSTSTMATPIWRIIGGALQAPIGAASQAIATLTPALRPAPLPCQLPARAPALAVPSSPEQVDAVLSALAERAPVWAAMPFAERAALLRASIKTAVQVRESERKEEEKRDVRSRVDRQAGFPSTSTLSSLNAPQNKPKLKSQVSKPAAQAAVDAKGSYGTGAGEEWIGWMPVMWALRLVRKVYFFRFFRFFFALDVASLPAPSLLSFLETPTSIFLSPSS